MKTNIQICLVLLFFSTMASCSRLDMIGMISGTSPTIDERFEQSQQYNTEHGFATLPAPADNYHVYVCTDTHINGTRKRWEEFVDAYRADDVCPVAVHLGDIIDAKTDFNYVHKNASFSGQCCHFILHGQEKALYSGRCHQFHHSVHSLQKSSTYG